MRVLILGAGGMLGHKLLQRLSRQFEVAGTIRAAAPDAALSWALSGVRMIGRVSADECASVERALNAFRPDAVVNCIGIIKQLEAAKDPIALIRVNALFPHLLARQCENRGARLVHFSTDCVFSGARGNYSEDDAPDAQDLYGRTKLLGEVAGVDCLTMRCSIVGHELRGHRSLIDWFLSQRGGRVKGFTRALYTGVPTIVMADLVAQVLTAWPGISGLWHVASDPVSKYDLLCVVNRVYDLGITIEPDGTVSCDRRLDGSRFRARTGWTAPPWESMIERMRGDASSPRAAAPAS